VNKLCPTCGAERNDRNFCMACYERVAREKPLIAWVESKRSKTCLRCKAKFVPEQRYWGYCPKCWGAVKYDVLKSKKNLDREYELV
jgi:hypothetical protein